MPRPHVSTGSSHNDVVRAAGRRVMRRDSSRWSHAFLLVHRDRTNVYTIYARTIEEKAKWMEAFKEASHNAHLGTTHILRLSYILAILTIFCPTL